MIKANAPVEEAVTELEQLIKGLRDGTIKCAVLHKTGTYEKIGTDVEGKAMYAKSESVDISFSKWVTK